HRCPLPPDARRRPLACGGGRQPRPIRVRRLGHSAFPLDLPDMDGGERGDRDVVAILERYKAIFDVVASSIDGMDFRAHIHMKSRHEDSPYALTLPSRAVHEVIRRSPWHSRAWPHCLPGDGPPAHGRVSRLEDAPAQSPRSYGSGGRSADGTG